MIKAIAPISKPEITKRLHDIYGKQILEKLSDTGVLGKKEIRVLSAIRSRNYRHRVRLCLSDTMRRYG
ncbi:hypothetical protein pdam_00021914 [Pocillopora damicornis]|uniref:Uncharacterized protein n=1 Tax=Pocillopora damicornis TaxID=46731 RepID=A0A3M6TN48_POCDA|nr:hypothetical protein pdam_00021914 [Pocillopora damicornis]